VALSLAPAALALKKSEKELFLAFKHCPLTEAIICDVANTTGGEFVIGKKTVPISKPVLIQGGVAANGKNPVLEAEPLIAAVGAETFAKVPQEVPGGLAGIGGIGGEVTATAELAGPVSSVILDAWNLANKLNQPAVTLPLKVRLSNEILGENCYIGSDAEPIVLHLTTGKTNPPAGTEPISGGHGAPEYPAKGDIERVPGVKLVDNTFAVPGASGCGNELDSSVVDEAIDLDIGLPAAAGSNTAILTGSAELTLAQSAKKYLPKEKKTKKS
jgi:hypothetical protein